MAVPGQAFGVTARVRNSGSKALAIQEIALDLPAGWRVTSTSSGVQSVSPGQKTTATFRVTAPENAEYTRPYWHRNDPETEGVNTVDDPHYATLAFPPAPLQAHMHYSVDALKSSLGGIVSVSYRDSTGHEQKRALAVAPPFSIAIEPISQVIPVGHRGSSSVKVDVRSGLPGPVTASVRLEAPQGWRVEPASQPVTFAKVGESKECQFTVVPLASREERDQLKASLTYHNKAYAEGYTVVTRDDLDTFYYYQPAVQRVSVVDVKVPAELKVGYVMGAGDDIPTVLRQVGLDVTMIPAEKLTTEDLGRYQTIVLGIRAYDTQKDVAANNKRLLEFVSAGGTLVVQYEADVGNFNGGSFAPYPVTLGRGRVSVEEASVEVLAPQERVFHFPNEITQRDFEGWVQERGLYFMEKWDEKFTPLLASHDPGEDSLKGGLLVAKYGKGVYIYTGYAFFRQLPAGVPGAVRLYVNLLAAGQIVGGWLRALTAWPSDGKSFVTAESALRKRQRTQRNLTGHRAHTKDINRLPEATSRSSLSLVSLSDRFQADISATSNQGTEVETSKTGFATADSGDGVGERDVAEHARHDWRGAVHYYAFIVSAMGGPQAMLGWILGAGFAICDGLVWAELGAAMPGSGGSYRYLREIYGPNSWDG